MFFQGIITVRKTTVRKFVDVKELIHVVEHIIQASPYAVSRAIVSRRTGALHSSHFLYCKCI